MSGAPLYHNSHNICFHVHSLSPNQDLYFGKLSPDHLLIAVSPSVAITQGGAIQLANNGTDGMQGLQTLTMTNASAAQQGTTILQYAQTSDGQQILVPSNQVVVQGERDYFPLIFLQRYNLVLRIQTRNLLKLVNSYSGLFHVKGIHRDSML